MNLPHQEPLIFAKKIVQRDKSTATVLCEFSTIPTISMFIEAAAQSSSAFSNHEDIKIGFLTLAKNVKLLNEIREKKFLLNLNIEIELNNIKQFSFEAYQKQNGTKVVTGNFTIAIQ